MPSPGRPSSAARAGQVVGHARNLETDAELVLELARGDFFVRAGVDIGIDPERDSSGRAEFLGGGADRVQLLFGLDVEHADRVGEREANLAGRRE